MSLIRIGLCGLGVVGSAIMNTFLKHGLSVACFDKYKNYYDCFEDVLLTDILFLALPTPFSEEQKTYDLSAIYEVLARLESSLYKGVVVIKSTILPGSMRQFQESYPHLQLLHNPEFLSARTALYDFEEQTHIVIGSKNVDAEETKTLYHFYKTYWTKAQYSLCTWEESEFMKISCNAFYATKIQFFNEIYQLVRLFSPHCSYENVILMMIRNGWISPQHTQVPGTDGQLSYGGMCFPKDTCALLQCMIQQNTPHKVLLATGTERNAMRRVCDKK